MPLMTNENKIQILTPLLGVQEERVTRYSGGHLSKLIKSTPGSRGRGTGFGVTGGRDADEDGIGGTKTRREKG